MARTPEPGPPWIVPTVREEALAEAVSRLRRHTWYSQIPSDPDAAVAHVLRRVAEHGPLLVEERVMLQEALRRLREKQEET